MMVTVLVPVVVSTKLIRGKRFNSEFRTSCAIIELVTDQNVDKRESSNACRFHFLVESEPRCAFVFQAF